MPTPSEQLLTRTVYATDGVTTNWDFSFSGGYLDKSHVKAFTEAATGERTEIIVTEAMIVGPFQVRIAPALEAGLTLTVYRDTPKDLPLVDFTDESGFSEIALDTNAKQAVFIAAETTDTVNTSSSYDAEQSASQAAIAAGEAQASAAAAAASALLAANEADASEVSATASAASAVNSANSAASSSAAATAVFNANTTTYTRTLLDDTTASAARATLGAATAGPLSGSGITGAAASGANTDITSLGNIASINGGQLAGMRNRIINGACNVAQRAALAYPNNTSGYSGPDRFQASNNGAGGQFTQSQSTVTHNGIVKNTVRQTVNTALGALPTGVTYWFGLCQRLEGSNCYDLKGQPIALSFVFNTNVSGTYSVSLNDSSVARSYVTTFIAVANTPTRFTFAIPADASLNIPNNNGLGLSVFIGFLNGATYQTPTLSAWQAGALHSATGATNWAATAGNFIELTELQLEMGTVATPFEHRLNELALCQRYYEAIAEHAGNGSAANSAGSAIRTQYKVTKRVVPAVAYTVNQGSVVTSYPTVEGCTFQGTSNASNYLYIINILSTAEL